LNTLEADHLSAALFALADPTRRSILARLAAGDAPVKELAAPYDMSLAAVSKHLKVLERAGLVSRGKEAQWRPCHLEVKPLEDMSAWMGDFRRLWERNLDSLGTYLKAMNQKNQKRLRSRPSGRKRR
jgi:DNA-binding transcriptional ArsR family regulator